MRVDLRARLALLAAVTTAVMAFADPRWNLLVLGGLVGLLACLGVRTTGFGRVLRGLAPIMVLVGLAAAFATPDRVLHDPDHLRVWWQWGWLRVTPGGVLTGLNFGLRMISMVLVSWVVVVNTEVDEVLELAAHWRFPAWASIMVSTALAAVPSLARRREQIGIAQQARGLRLSGRNPLRRWTASVAIMVPLITSALLRAENLAIALSVRGYGAHPTMTSMRDLVWRRRDLAVAIGSLLVAMAAVVVRLVFGLGRL